jgi:hypothetical protein
MDVNLSLNEIEVLLLLWIPREQQDLGKYADSARAKLLEARKVELGLFAEMEEG